ncbi:hypothetical protein [Cerasicoccus frondis]|uniref:hypothetical protein n=1 Tax=Cerasicoccus frondis TaxID=490090 RepID=UPI002852BD26|nr:hypothetical protein [Cerasicoccus frondis]
MQGAKVTGLSKLKKPNQGSVGDQIVASSDNSAFRTALKRPGESQSMAGASRDTNVEKASGSEDVGKFATRLKKRPLGLFTPPAGTPGADKQKSGRSDAI